MKYRDLRSLFALFLLFLSPLAIAGSPESVDAVELTEEVAQPDTDSELLPTEAENGEEILGNRRKPKGNHQVVCLTDRYDD